MSQPGGSGTPSQGGKVVEELTDDSPPSGLKTTRTGNDVIRRRRGNGLHLTLLGQRFLLARSMLVVTALLALVILGAAFFTSDSNYQQLKELAPIVFTPIVTLLGTSIAWYYASDAKKEESKESRDDGESEV